MTKGLLSSPIRETLRSKKYWIVAIVGKNGDSNYLLLGSRGKNIPFMNVFLHITRFVNFGIINGYCPYLLVSFVAGTPRLVCHRTSRSALDPRPHFRERHTRRILADRGRIRQEDRLTHATYSPKNGS